MPDRIRKIQVRLPMVEMDWLFVKRATDHAKTRMTTVRMAVAKLESTCSTPTFASTAVSPAKHAESNAQMNQFIFLPPSKFPNTPCPVVTNCCTQRDVRQSVF
jgi:hypothetical protein